jgi:hypothetical protein
VIPAQRRRIDGSWNIPGEVCYAPGMMRRVHAAAWPDVPEWEPEPLRVPVAERWDEDRRGRRIQSEDGDDDLPGSHVIVIDLA